MTQRRARKVAFFGRYLSTFTKIEPTFFFFVKPSKEKKKETLYSNRKEVREFLENGKREGPIDKMNAATTHKTTNTITTNDQDLHYNVLPTSTI